MFMTWFYHALSSNYFHSSILSVTILSPWTQTKGSQEFLDYYNTIIHCFKRHNWERWGKWGDGGKKVQKCSHLGWISLETYVQNKGCG
jgi:hypothetical protein